MSTHRFTAYGFVLVPAALVMSACLGSSPAEPVASAGPFESVVVEGGVKAEGKGGEAPTKAKKPIDTKSATADSQPPSSASAEGGNGVASDTEPRFVTEGKLVVCADIPNSPYAYYQPDSDGPIGIDADLLKAVAADNGLTVEFVQTPFESIFAALEGQECDVIGSSVTITPARETKYAFSKGYFSTETESFGFVFLNNNKALRDAVNISLDELGDTGVTETIIATYAP
jgi:ABC-type amino acid transport substrate-binding protein